MLKTNLNKFWPINECFVANSHTRKYLKRTIREQLDRLTRYETSQANLFLSDFVVVLFDLSVFDLSLSHEDPY